ncbi:hypothetical protein [Nevskia sp.]|uniref:hypothetical protein n=1 Tax=Nevskia sp. TaxID=1929292 RepID=UPI0025CC5042|nr:hypothetical protein [Nevskia sp.]
MRDDPGAADVVALVDVAATDAASATGAALIATSMKAAEVSDRDSRRISRRAED